MKENAAPSPSRVWTSFLIVLATLFLGITTWSFLRASQGVSAVVDRDYYSHGLRYNNTNLERQAATSQGWRLATSYSHPILEARLLDKSGGPITDCNGEVRLQLPDGTTASLPVTEEAPGSYRFGLPGKLRGEVLVQLTFRRAQASIQQRMLINLPEA